MCNTNKHQHLNKQIKTETKQETILLQKQKLEMNI